MYTAVSYPIMIIYTHHNKYTVALFTQNVLIVYPDLQNNHVKKIILNFILALRFVWMSRKLKTSRQ